MLFIHNNLNIIIYSYNATDNLLILILMYYLIYYIIILYYVFMYHLSTHTKYNQVERRVSADLSRVVVDGVNLG